jgi:putative ABC transport system permease protein
MLGLFGGIGGLVIALWGIDLMKSAMPSDVPFWLRVEIDGRVFLFVAGLALVAALISGLIPALKVTRPCLITQLKEGGRSTDDLGATTHGLRNILVITEVALAVVLLVGALLLLRSFANLRGMDAGFNRENVLTFRSGYPEAIFKKDPSGTKQFFRDIEARIAALPGVTSVGVTSLYFATCLDEIHPFTLEGPEMLKVSDAPLAAAEVVSPGYFHALQVPLIAGRGFNESDVAESIPVAVVDSDLAEKYFGSAQAAVGRRIRFVGTGPEWEAMKMWIRIVGVVGNVVMNPKSSSHLPQVYRPMAQGNMNFMSLVVRTTGDPTSYTAAVRSEVQSVNRDIPIYMVATLDDILLREVWIHRFFSYQFAIAGGLSLFLASIGIYGVMTYNVARRQQELGMRMALGAQPKEVIRLVLRHGLGLVAIGIAIGLVGAFAAVPLLRGTLYGVSPHDLVTFTLAPTLLIALAALACYMPSRRISQIDPNAALRCE